DAPSGPSREQMQAAERMAPEDRAAMIRDMVAGLAARLEEQPGDIDGWRRLGRSYQVLGEPQKAADAYRQVAVALPDDLEAQLDYADALLAAAPDDLPPAALRQMRRVLALDPQNPLALFYLGQAAAQAGDAATARAHWQLLLGQVPASAPERAQIQRLLDQLPATPDRD
ncbi:MAG: tetratricopeptide repeat protein, partial [Geminicoccaceae bacterium]